MMFSIVQSFFFKFNAHNRIENGILEKNLVDFFNNFRVESDYEPFYIVDKNTITIDWCTHTNTFYTIVYENRIVLIKNDNRITVDIAHLPDATVQDYITEWIIL